MFKRDRKQTDDISILFSRVNIGALELRNRWAQSATYEAMATQRGRVTGALVDRYRTLAAGKIGLIVPGFMFVNMRGKAAPYQVGLHSDDMIPGLAELVRSVHKKKGKIFFQLAHAGMQARKRITGTTPVAPSAKLNLPFPLFLHREMNENDIEETIEDFAAAAGRAVAAGADGIQLHAAHGYLINQFISPFFNRRVDSWGGNEKNRFRFLAEVFKAVRRSVPEDTPITVKLNTHDYTPRKGVTPGLARSYAVKLARLGVDGIELSSGTLFFSFMNICRGDTPIKQLIKPLPFWLRIPAFFYMKQLRDQSNIKEGYNLGAARLIRPHIGKTLVYPVGGIRGLPMMVDVLKNNHADLISMSRPFIREPLLVKKIMEGKTVKAACISCNRCLAAVANDMPLRCYAGRTSATANRS